MSICVHDLQYFIVVQKYFKVFLIFDVCNDICMPTQVVITYRLNTLSMQILCSRYVFTSKSDEERHTLLVHGGKRGVEFGERDPHHPVQQNKCKVCDEAYPTRYQLIKHQKATNHTLAKGRPQMRRKWTLKSGLLKPTCAKWYVCTLIVRINVYFPYCNSFVYDYVQVNVKQSLRGVYC